MDRDRLLGAEGQVARREGRDRILGGEGRDRWLGLEGQVDLWRGTSGRQMGGE